MLPHLLPLVSHWADARVLHVGCGNSTLADALFHTAGIRDQTLLDVSDVCIQQQTTRCAAAAVPCVCRTGDVRQLPRLFPAASFDVVIDKGCFDSLVCSGERSRENAIEMLQGTYALLKPGGVLLVRIALV